MWVFWCDYDDIMILSCFIKFITAISAHSVDDYAHSYTHTIPVTLWQKCDTSR
jgi:hypothetical protein